MQIKVGTINEDQAELNASKEHKRTPMHINGKFKSEGRGVGREFIKGELQHQNKLSSSERPFKILQSETKIDCFREKRQKTENVVF